LTLADAATLRSEHRICGVLTGTLPHLSQQNVFLGLPLVLMPEELVLLVEKREWSCPD
jgi:tRNA-splicing endonuclease subunit Sen34